MRPAHIPGAAPQPIRAAGGSTGALIGGMSVVAAGLLAFYFAQFNIQGKRTPANVKNLAEIPTWQLRHAQQMPGAVPSAPSGEAQLFACKTPDFQPNPSATLPLPGRNIATGGIVTNLLSRSRGIGTDEAHPRRIPQPAPTTRKNEAGKTYTKNSDYVKSYKRDY